MNSILEVLMNTVLEQDEDIYHGVRISSVEKVDKEIMALKTAIGYNTELSAQYEKTMNALKTICDEYALCIFKKGVAAGFNISGELQNE